MNEVDPKKLHPAADISKSIFEDSNQNNFKDTPGNAEIERLTAKIDTLRNGNLQQVLLITSALLGEGKSTVATRIAQSIARNRQNPALIIDFDIRRPRLHRIFDVVVGCGVVDILSYNMKLQKALKPTSIPNLYLLTSGVINESPVELFNYDKLQKFFSEVKKQFDYIIVDAPPVIPVSDPLVLGKMVDNVLLVVKAGRTSRNVVKRAIDLFHDIKVDISGIILNNIENVLPYYYDQDYYGYKYFETNTDLLLE